jgi:glucose/arabinose dehydrogenase
MVISGRSTIVALLFAALMATASSAAPPANSPEPKPAAKPSPTSAPKPAAKVAPKALAPKPAPKATATPTAPPAPKAVFECRWTTEKIAVDGRADEEAWKTAPTIDGFRANWADRSAKTATRAKLLWDANYLYFFADMDDGDLFSEVTWQDGPLWLDDVFELFFKPDEKRSGYYEFEVNAVNTHMEMYVRERNPHMFRKHGTVDEFDWQTAVVRRGTLNVRTDRDEGWSVEGRIPWTDLGHTGGRPAPDETWGFALCRYDYDVRDKAPELSANAPFHRMNYHDYEHYPLLKFVGPREARPYGIDKLPPPAPVSNLVGSPDPAPPYRSTLAYPKLKLSPTIIARRQPETSLLWVVTTTKGTGATPVLRFVDDPATESTELVHQLDGVITDLIFHPKFTENGYVYFGWNGPLGAERGKKFCRVTRFTVDRKPPYAIDKNSEKLIIEWQSDGHNGLALAFANDGRFFVTTGDGTSDSDDDVVGQDMTKLLAKVLRIEIDQVTDADRAAGRAYSVPKDNPFVGREGIRPETWAYGLRNPWRSAVDPQTGHLWVTQNGQDLWEQVYFVRPGENYGWSVTEGGRPFYTERKRGPTPIVDPTVEHSHAEARSLTGGIVYYGKKYSELRGAYLYGDYSTGKIWAVKHDGTKVTYHREIADTTIQITGFVEDKEGEVLVCDYRGGDDGGLHRLEPNPSGPPSKFPRRLSESGLFVAGEGHTVAPGLIPYDVNSPLWSDGTYKERFIALPPEGKIGYASRQSWNFPEGTVLVKSFALEGTAGDPKSRRWIETRFLTKQQNEWIGYSYAWNDEQTDAELVEAIGRDKVFAIPDGNAESKRPSEPAAGVRKQTWHYPSRAECMICHSRAAHYVLGLSTAQMNRDFDYPCPASSGTGAAAAQAKSEAPATIRDNQLRTLVHLGLLKIDPATELRDSVVHAATRRGLSVKTADRIGALTARRPATPPKSAPVPGFDVWMDELLPRLANPADESAPIEARARSYLHANCAHCHVPAGGGNAQFEIQYWTKLLDSRTLDVKPVHTTFGIPDAKLIAPGAPERSLMLHRTAQRGRGQMPPLASSLVDPVGVDVLRRWLTAMPRPRKPTMVEP